MNHSYKRQPLLLLIGLALSGTQAYAQTEVDEAEVVELPTLMVTAEEELKQSLGVSIITAEDIEKRPPANDISELLRTMPGVNLTGNSTSGQRGNNRQIDIRGMGPENTLILVDGKPVSSRNAVRYGWRGERDTRGDTNWVPADQIERVEVLRGPAAARYGSGAAGGVVNIITKKANDKLSGSISTYINSPQHSEEGSTRRITFGLNGPITDSLSFRLYGNVAKTESDDEFINKDHASMRIGQNAGSLPAGREGVRNRDFNGVLTWTPRAGHEIDFSAGYSRQGNIYTGDTMNTNSNDEVRKQIGAETNRTYRQTYSVTHRGDWSDNTRTLAYLQYEQTRNSRLLEGLAGGTDGAFNNPELGNGDGGFGDIDLRTITAHAELNRSFDTGSVSHIGTIGVEWVYSSLDDPSSDLRARANEIPGQPHKVPEPPLPYNPKSHARIFSVFVEDNIFLTDALTLTPGVRFDYHDRFGSNWSPSLNLSYALTPELTIKGGIARAYKAPNLYQGNSGFAQYSAGNGCYGGLRGCYLIGSDDLKGETSINKEIGLEYIKGGLLASIAYFHNDYRDKVEAGITSMGTHLGSDIFQWSNIPEAVVEGLEGNLTLPLRDNLKWSTNFTYMLKSENKTTGERLSVIPEFTINSRLDWQVNEKFSTAANLTWYGTQKPQRFDYYGRPNTGTAADAVSPYALVGVSGSYRVNKNFHITAGVNNIFDKRIFRRGNAVGVSVGTPHEVAGAGAYTYNEPGRTYFLSMNASF